MINEKIKQVVEEAFQTYVDARVEKEVRSLSPSDENYLAFLRGRLGGMKRLLKAMDIEFKYSFKCKCDPNKENFLDVPCPCASYTLKELKEDAPC